MEAFTLHMDLHWASLGRSRSGYAREPGSPSWPAPDTQAGKAAVHERLLPHLEVMIMNPPLASEGVQQ